LYNFQIHEGAPDEEDFEAPGVRGGGRGYNSEEKERIILASSLQRKVVNSHQFSVSVDQKARGYADKYQYRRGFNEDDVGGIGSKDKGSIGGPGRILRGKTWDKAPKTSPLKRKTENGMVEKLPIIKNASHL
jgi:hypothetical protein